MSYNLFSFLCLYRKEETMEEYKKKYEEWLNNPCFDEETKKELESIKDNEKENMIKFLDGLNSLKDIIPEIKYMETGININPKNEYDAILISEFESFEDLDKYKKNPEHIKISELCKKIRLDRQAIDFEIK